MGFANLHLHTCFSDGQTRPADLAKLITDEPDLQYFALTDHDTLSAIEPLYRSVSRLMSSTHTQKYFIPGIELSLVDDRTGNTIHLLGYFPQITEGNVSGELMRIDAVLGEFCRYRAENRAVKDVDARIKRAFELNLDGIADRFDAPETVIRILREKSEVQNRNRFKEAEKEGDAIQYPIPATYQVIIDNWEELLPNGSREKAALYVLRKDPSKKERLTQIYLEEGLDDVEAAVFAERNQASLLFFKEESPLKELDVFDGLELLKKAGAVTVLAHPAIDHVRVPYNDYDNQILYPLIEEGLQGIEVFYPYDISFRAEAVDRYHAMARKHGLLISGGTDFHGDGRTGLSDIKLEIEHALGIIEKGCGG